jgi:hypothetical protein
LRELGSSIFEVAIWASRRAAGDRDSTVAVYDVPPYGYFDTDGSISGISVDLWRRVAER